MTNLADPVGHLYGLVGEAGIADVTRRFNEKVRVDDVIGPMYPPDEWEAAERRLRMFLVERFGGPPQFSTERGHPRLRMRHAPFAITPAGAERWIELMSAAVNEAALPAAFGEAALPFLAQVATFLVNRAE